MDERWPKPVQAAAHAVQRLAYETAPVAAAALVGSWARNNGRPDSDVDLVVLTREPDMLLTNTDWFTYFDADPHLISARDFGAIQERRLLTSTGLEVEIGIGTPSWADLDPVDQGTLRVVRDGMVILYDPAECLRALQLTVRSSVA